MKANSKIPEPRVTLQELLDPPRHIPQLDLCEYFNAFHALERTRFEVETLGALIVKKLILKYPLQPGQLVASLDSKGQLQVTEAPRQRL